ncbi:MAG: hypothetical protein KDB14_26295 [Planctomycetales bacterium]|nr:hypothetical protein [Planctomycetales bacterium]
MSSQTKGFFYLVLLISACRPTSMLAQHQLSTIEQLRPDDAWTHVSLVAQMLHFPKLLDFLELNEDQMASVNAIIRDYHRNVGADRSYHDKQPPVTREKKQPPITQRQLEAQARLEKALTSKQWKALTKAVVQANLREYGLVPTLASIHESLKLSPQEVGRLNARAIELESETERKIWQIRRDAANKLINELDESQQKAFREFVGSDIGPYAQKPLDGRRARR